MNVPKILLYKWLVISVSVTKQIKICQNIIMSFEQTLLFYLSNFLIKTMARLT